MKRITYIIGGIVILIILVGGVVVSVSLNGNEQELLPTATNTDEPTPTDTPTDTPTVTPTPTDTPETVDEAEDAEAESTATPTDTSTPTPTDTPAAEPTDTPTPEPTATDDNTSPDPCAEHGGLAWQGEVCVCSGYMDIVTLCIDGTKWDEVTDQMCTPDEAACIGDGGDSDGNGGGRCDPSCQSDSPPCGVCGGSHGGNTSE